MSEQKTSQVIELVVDAPGDPSVGIPHTQEDITVTIHVGGWPQSDIVELTNELRILFGNFMGDGTEDRYCFTKQDYDARMAAEKVQEEAMERQEKEDNL